jgi:hypothetical protein
MAQHDYVIANGTGAAVRSDINNGLAAIVSNNSGASAPATTYAYMLWADTSTNLLKLRNGANSAWITVGDLTAANLGLAALASPTFTGTVTIPTATISTGVGIPLGSAASPTIYFTGDTNTGIYSPGADQFAITTGGSGRVFVDSSGRVGLGSSTPGNKIQINDSIATTYSASNTLNGGVIGYVKNASTTNSTDATIRLEATGSGQVAAASISSVHTGDGVSALTFGTRNTGDVTERLRITGAGLVGIGTTSPRGALDVTGSIFASGGSQIQITGSAGSTGLQLIGQDSAESLIGTMSAQALAFRTNSSERARIDSSGRLLVGTSSARTQYGVTTQVLVEGTSNNTSSIGIISNAASGGGANLLLGRSKGGSIGSNTAVTNNDNLGGIYFQGANGTDLSNCGAAIEAIVDGTVSGGGAGDLPSRLVFSTTADGASSPTERMRITNDGTLLVGKTTNANGTAGSYFEARGFAAYTVSAATVGYFNRLSSDGTIIDFAQDTISEGSISVSGTTVSYNGAHLSRWSQLPGGAEREGILRGTVLSNIDEMCDWGEEDNEQLNRMKVSDVEGDPNVSGVFQAWDDDDDTYTDDFYCAMTGDFIIRIAEGVTVQRGDLLMSAGDGTATPQDDDIIRSKTIAKVTSTHVTCTYDDGSYCVPCVLMAC